MYLKTSRHQTFMLLVVFTMFCIAVTPLSAQERGKMVQRLSDCSEILAEFMNIPEESIPQSLLNDCEALVIIPHVVKGAFIFGAHHGRGIMIHRLPGGAWSSPSFVSITGGSVGFQIGGTAFDLVLVVNNKRGYESLLQSNFKFSGNVSAVAGPVGRSAEAGTDAKLKAEIYSYARAKGVFVGISLEGAVLNMDNDANTAFYGKAVDYHDVLNNPDWPFPEEAKPVIEQIETYIKKES